MLEADDPVAVEPLAPVCVVAPAPALAAEPAVLVALAADVAVDFGSGEPVVAPVLGVVAPVGAAVADPPTPVPELSVLEPSAPVAVLVASPLESPGVAAGTNVLVLSVVTETG